MLICYHGLQLSTRKYEMLPMRKTQTPYLLSLNDFVNQNPTMVTKEQIYNFMRRKKKNGADIWVYKVGGKIYVDVDQFFKWAKERGR